MWNGEKVENVYFISDSNPKTHNPLKFGTKTVKFFFVGGILQKGFWHPPFAFVIGLITFSRGRIFFPDFCHLCLRKFREFNEDHFRQELFKVRRLSPPLPCNTANITTVFRLIIWTIIFLKASWIGQYTQLQFMNFDFPDTLWHRPPPIEVSCQEVPHPGDF